MPIRPTVTVLACLLILGLSGVALALELRVSDIHDRDDGRVNAEAIEIVAARNGTFSGKAVVAGVEDGAFRATLSELTGPGGAIADEHVRIRYGQAWESNIGRGRPGGSDILLNEPSGDQSTVPVWVSVAVPADAAAGVYEAELAVRGRGGESAALPVRVTVADWSLPDTQDYRTWMEIIQSPDTLAEEYGVEPWSERHWELIGRSLELIAASGSRVVYIPLIAHTNQGNAESMVQWVRQADGSYEHDYTIMDRYLDVVEQHMGEPKMVVLYAWDIYLVSPDEEPEAGESASRYAQEQARLQRERWLLRDQGPAVTVIDAATGEKSPEYLPRYAEPEAEELWRPVWRSVRERLAHRGLEDAMMIGTSTDFRPTREQTEVLHRLSGGLAWVSQTHHARWLEGGERSGRGAMHNIADIGYSVTALGYMYTVNPKLERNYAWQLPHLSSRTMFWRFAWFNTNTLSTIRHEPEANITGNQRGVGRLGGDFWPAIRDQRGRRRANVAAPNRHPQSHWRSLNIGAWMLAPGPDGPVPTARYMALVEGVQACEARIAIEDVLTDPSKLARIDDALAQRAQEVLDTRHRAIWQARGGEGEDIEAHGLMRRYREIYGMMNEWDAAAGNQWFIDSGWAQAMGELFEVAGEIERALAGE